MTSQRGEEVEGIDLFSEYKAWAWWENLEHSDSESIMSSYLIPMIIQL